MTTIPSAKMKSLCWKNLILTQKIFIIKSGISINVSKFTDMLYGNTAYTCIIYSSKYELNCLFYSLIAKFIDDKTKANFSMFCFYCHLDKFLKKFASKPTLVIFITFQFIKI